MKKEIPGLKPYIDEYEKSSDIGSRNEAKGISEKEREDLTSEANPATTQKMTDLVRRESYSVFFWGPRLESQAAEEEERISAETKICVKDLCSRQLGQSVHVVCKRLRLRGGKIVTRPMLDIVKDKMQGHRVLKEARKLKDVDELENVYIKKESTLYKGRK